MGYQALVGMIAALALASGANAQSWQLAGGGKSARIQTGGPISGAAFTCDGPLPILAVRLPKPAPRNPTMVAVAAGTVAFSHQLMRVPNADTWIARIPANDLDRLFGVTAATVMISIPGIGSASLPTAGLKQAGPSALAPCHRGKGAPVPAAAAAPKPAGGGTAGGGGDVQAITQVIKAVYQSFDATPHYTTEFKSIYQQCTGLQDMMTKRGRGDETFGLCLEDAASICQCQDMDEAVIQRTLKVTTATLRPGVMRATATFDLFREANSTRRVHYLMVKTARGWQIDDIGDGERKGLVGGIQEMRATLKMPRWVVPPAARPAA